MAPTLQVESAKHRSCFWVWSLGTPQNAGNQTVFVCHTSSVISPYVVLAQQMAGTAAGAALGVHTAYAKAVKRVLEGLTCGRWAATMNV